jgi:ankyrin repeat protein
MPLPADPIEELAAAVRSGNTARAAEVLNQHPEVRSRLDGPMPGGHFGATALLSAVNSGNRAMAELLLDHGADINARSHWWAGGFGVLDRDPDELTGFLISRGATVDAYAAARLGRLDRLRELIAADPASVRSRGGDGQTPLHVASTVAIAECLLDAGADIDAPDVDHESTPAQYLVRDRQDVVRYLVERGCRTDILMVSAIGDLAHVRGHLDRDPSSVGMTVSEDWFPKRNPKAGGTIYTWTLGAYKLPHVIAREFGHEDVVQLLMERSPAEVTLAAACELGDDRLVKELTASGQGRAGARSAEHLRRLPDAAETDRIAAVRLMLEAGWPVNTRGSQGGTALHWACWNGNLEMTREILRHQPDLDMKDLSYGGSPIGWAAYGSTHGWRCKTGDYAGVVRALLDAGATPPPGGSDLNDPDVSDAVRAVLQERRSPPC